MATPRFALLCAVSIVASMSMTACATKPILAPDIGVVVLQGDTALDASYNVAAQAYLDRVSGMDPATKAWVKPTLQALYRATTAADAAEMLGDATTVAAQIKAAGDLYTRLKPVLQLK